MMPELTLEQLRRCGVIRIGFQRHTPPFCYALGSAFHPIGYSVDLARGVVGHLSHALGCTLAIEPVEITSSTREAQLLAGHIDIECGSTTVTEARLQRVAFSRPVFRTAHRVCLKRHLATRLRQTLRITGISGSTSQATLVRVPPPGLTFDFSGRASIGEAFEAYCHDPTVDGLVADEVILASLLKQITDTHSNVLDMRLGSDDYCFMLRQADRALLAAVDGALEQLMGAADFLPKLSPWFDQPIPGARVSLGLDLAAHVAPITPLPATSKA